MYRVSVYPRCREESLPILCSRLHLRYEASPLSIYSSERLLGSDQSAYLPPPTYHQLKNTRGICCISRQILRTPASPLSPRSHSSTFPLFLSRLGAFLIHPLYGSRWPHSGSVSTPSRGGGVTRNAGLYTRNNNKRFDPDTVCGPRPCGRPRPP